MKKLYNEIDKWSRMVLGIIGLFVSATIMVTGIDFGWGAAIAGLVGVLIFGKMLKSSLEKFEWVG